MIAFIKNYIRKRRGNLAVIQSEQDRIVLVTEILNNEITLAQRSISEAVDQERREVANFLWVTSGRLSALATSGAVNDAERDRLLGLADALSDVEKEIAGEKKD